MSRSRNFTKENKTKKEKDSTLSYATDDSPLMPLRRNGELNFSIFTYQHVCIAIIK